MERLEALKHILTSDETARERGDMPMADWAALLREQRDIRKEETKMTIATKARESMTKLQTRRQELEQQFTGLYEGLKEAENASSARILEGQNVAKEMERLAQKKAERDALANAIELSKEREAAAADELYQIELKQAWIDARKLWLAGFKKIDKLEKALEKITAEFGDLDGTYRKLERMGHPFVRREGISLFSPEASIISQAARIVETLEKQLKPLKLSRARYEVAYTDERKKG